MQYTPNNYLDMFKPPPEVLKQCHEVLLGDPKELMWKMKKFCRDSDLSLIWSELTDVTDHSYTYDMIVAFYFIDEQDAIMFSLKYK
jgi:hypothetical protein